MNEEEKLIQEQFNKLPPELQQALSAVPWKASVKEIAALNKLSPEQAENFERETMFILYGFENPASYIDKLVQEVPVDEEVAANIAGQVDEKILKPISARLENKKEEPPSKKSFLPKESKDEAMRRLTERRVDTGEKPHVPEIAPEIHPMTTPPPDLGFNIKDLGIKREEKPMAQPRPQEKPPIQPPKTHYPTGQDPYREPLE